MKNHGNMFIVSRVVLCANAGGTTLVLTGSQLVLKVIVVKMSVRGFWFFFWHSKYHSRTTDEL